MSAASDYGVEVVERLIVPAFVPMGTFTQNDAVTAAGDVIAYLMHWADAKHQPGDEIDTTDPGHTAASMGHGHYLAERGEGDDLIDDDGYEDALERLAGFPTLLPDPKADERRAELGRLLARHNAWEHHRRELSRQEEEGPVPEADDWHGSDDEAVELLQAFVAFTLAGVR